MKDSFNPMPKTPAVKVTANVVETMWQEMDQRLHLKATMLDWQYDEAKAFFYLGFRQAFTAMEKVTTECRDDDVTGQARVDAMVRECYDFAAKRMMGA